MPLDLTNPILYLITAGRTTESSTLESVACRKILDLISAAVDARIPLIQLREKRLTTRNLFELTERAVDLTRGTSSRLLINDRGDVAVAAGADGVHLTTRSLQPRTIRETFGADFLIGASTHSLAEAIAAREGGADFAIFGPVFETSSKAQFGAPVGIDALAAVAIHLKSFPILALGGVSRQNAEECLRAGASGVAGISLFDEAAALKETVAVIRMRKV
jgi:thiamine-phosphate pyrophosphorylase